MFRYFDIQLGLQMLQHLDDFLLLKHQVFGLGQTAEDNALIKTGDDFGFSENIL